MRRRRLGTILICILMLLLVFSGGLCGCGSADNQDGSGTDGASKTVSSKDKKDDAAGKQEGNTLTKRDASVIRIACWQKEPYLINLKAYLAETFPEYTIKVEYIQRDNYESVIDSQLSYNGAADIIFVTQRMTNRYARAGYLAPLTDVCRPFTEESQKAFKYLNNVYAVPSVSSYECFYYNKYLFEKYGLIMPKTYDQFLNNCVYVDKFRPGRAVSAGLKDGNILSNSALSLLQGEYLTTSKGKAIGARIKYGRASFHDELYPHLTEWEKMIDYGVFSPDMYLMDKEAAIREFTSEKSVFLIAGPEDYNHIKELAPDMDIGTLPYGSSGDSVPVIIGGCECGIAVNRYGGHEEAAKKIVRSLASYEGQHILWMDSKGSKTYLKDTDFGTPPEFEGISEVLSNNMYLSSKCWGEYDREVSAILGEELQQVLLKKETLEEALYKIDKRMKATVSEKQ